LNLLPGSKTTFLALLSESTVADVSKGYPETMFLDPPKFYQIADLQAPSSAILNWGLFSAYIWSGNPNFFVKSTQVLEIYIPSTFRNVNASINSMPNSTSYFLRCSQNGASCQPENFGSLVSFKNAANNIVAIPDFDTYLKTMPAASGGIPPLLARVVRLVEYQLLPHPGAASNYPADVG